MAVAFNARRAWIKRALIHSLPLGAVAILGLVLLAPIGGMFLSWKESVLLGEVFFFVGYAAQES